MAEVDPDTGQPPDRSGEVEDPTAARAAFLAADPGVITTPDDDAAVDEDAVLDELTRPPAEASGVTPPAPAPGPADPYAQYGGLEAVQNAWQVSEALRSELGVRTMIQQGLVALGYNAEQIKTALGTPGVPGAPAAAPDPFAGLDDDDVVTGAQLRQYLELQRQQAAEAQTGIEARATAAAQAQVNPIRAAFEDTRNREIATRNDATLAELLGPVPTESAEVGNYQALAGATLQAAAAYIDPANFDPGHIRAAITRGHADVVAREEARYQAYLATKRTTKRNAPANIGGQSAGESPEKEPQNLAEARAQFRAQGGFK